MIFAPYATYAIWKNTLYFIVFCSNSLKNINFHYIKNVFGPKKGISVVGISFLFIKNTEK